jgi:hypothetical protein
MNLVTAFIFYVEIPGTLASRYIYSISPHRSKFT